MIDRGFLRSISVAIPVMLVLNIAVADPFSDAMTDLRLGYWKQAYSSLKVLAKRGLADAQFQLGVMHHHGRGARQNYYEAMRLYVEAAGQGHAGAQNNIGVLYQNGEGVVRNPVVAYAWFSLAAAQLDGKARDNMRALQRQMTPELVVQAQQLAEEWVRGELRPSRGSASVTGVDSPPSVPPEQSKTFSSVEHEPVEGALRGYVVQLGLFVKDESVSRIRRRLADIEMKLIDEVVSLRGVQYRRLRVGPFSSEEQADEVSRRMDRIFRITSVSIPLK